MAFNPTSLFEMPQNDALIESNKINLTPRALKSFYKNKTAILDGIKTVKDCLKDKPKDGETVNCVTMGAFDLWSVIKFLIDEDQTEKEMLLASWIISKPVISDIISYLKKECFVKNECKIIVGNYFKSRDPLAYSFLLSEVKKIKCLDMVKATLNHSKMALIKSNGYFVVQGSANFTKNPRIEQISITNCKELYYFHKKWMVEV
jgi:hypothetical protein